MKNIVLILTLCFGFSFAQAEELTAAKKAVIDELLEITGALKVSEMMGNAIAGEMINAMAAQNKQISPKIVDIIKDEMGKLMHEQFIENRFIHETSYTVYHKYFSLGELQEMVDFYKTPTGSKVAKLLPQVTQESMAIGQKHGMSLGPLIQQRLQARFKAEGIE